MLVYLPILNALYIQLSYVNVPVSLLGNIVQIYPSIFHTQAGENILIQHLFQTIPQHKNYSVQKFDYKQHSRPLYLPKFQKLSKTNMSNTT